MSPTIIESGKSDKPVKSIANGESLGFFTPGRRVLCWARAAREGPGHFVVKPSTSTTDVVRERNQGLTNYVGPSKPGPHDLGLGYTARWVSEDQE